MAELPPARAVVRPLGDGQRAYDCVVLTYDERVLRRRRLVTVHDEGFLVDLPRTVRLEHGDGLELEDGRLVEVVAAEERLLEVRGAGLTRFAWHIGNRHAPCEILSDRLLVPADLVMRRMLEGLGAEVSEVSLPFNPEGGAYGEGHGHAHGEGYPSGLGALAGHVHGPDRTS
jgi:urease accessory protein